MTWTSLRRARVRGLKEGKVQSGRIEALGPEARDGVERHQDYGFAANPVDGEGLRIEAGGHTFILRVDRLASRPSLTAYEVCVWHDEGHWIILKAGGVIEANCTRFVINASAEVVFNTPTVTNSGDQVVVGTATAETVVGTTDVVFAGKSSVDHRHKDTEPGLGNSGTTL